ncbi:MAG: tandem-95 repeat protein [Calditrichaceae bacterium]|nr:tandem-95 repeat protein [Calditrichia bacterium]NUQ43098.1 tandem-95 repeat protein [Calditrichaceae bacterium]
MHKVVKVFELMILFLAVSTPGFSQSNYTWNGGVASWNDPAAWTPNGVPGAADTAIVNAGQANLDSDVQVAGFKLTGGTVYGGGKLAVTARMVWSNGYLTGDSLSPSAGNLVEVGPGATLELSGDNSKNLDRRTLVNKGTATWSGAGIFKFRNNAVFENQPGASFDIQNNALMDFVTPGGVFNNYGALAKSAGNSASTIDVPFHNSGTVTVAAGRLKLTRGGSGSNAVYNLNAGKILDFGRGAHLVDNVSFNGSGTVEISDDTLSIGAGGAAFGAAVTLKLSKGLLAVGSPISLGGILNWSRGAITGPGAISTNSLVINGSNTKTLSGAVLTCSGNGSWSDTGTLKLTDNAVLEIGPAAAFDIQNGALLDYLAPGGVFSNAGTLTKSAGPDTTTIDVFFNNTGVVNLNIGALRFNRGSSSSGSIFTLAAGTRLEFSGGVNDLAANVTLNGAGNFAVSGGTTNLLGAYNLSGTLEVSGGTFHGAGDLNLAGPLAWIGGDITGTGTITANNSLAISSDKPKKLDERILVNKGSATWNGAGSLRLKDLATFINGAGASFTIQGNGLIDVPTPNEGLFKNAGTILRSAGADTFIFALPVQNSGALDIRSGVVKFTNTLLNDAAGTIRGGKTLDVRAAAFTNNGAVNPGTSPGLLIVLGDYPQSASAALNIEIGGNAVGSEYDQLAVSDTARLGGTLNVSLVNNFTPALTDSFSILTYAGRNGQFDSVNIPTVNGDPVFEYFYRSDRLILKTVLQDTTPPNPGSGAVNDTVQTYEETPVNINVLANDGDPNGRPIVLISFSNPKKGIATLVSDSTINYAPFSNYFGADSFFYVISNDVGIRDTAQVLITVLPVNDPPAITPALPPVSFPEDGSYFLNLDAYVQDVDNTPGQMAWTASVLSAQPFTAETLNATPGGAKTLAIPSPIANRQSSIFNHQSSIEIDPSDLQIAINPVTHIAAFSASGDSSGIFTVAFTVSDPEGAVDTDTITVTVAPVNDAPRLALPDIAFPEDSSYTLNLDDYAADPEHGAEELSWSAEVIAAQGTDSPGAKIANLQSSRLPAVGQAIINHQSSIFNRQSAPGGIEVDPADLQVSIDPATRVASFSVSGDSSGVFTVVFSAADPEGATGADTITVAVAAVNDPPFLSAPIGDVSYPEDSGPHTVAANLGSVFGDPDPGATLIFSAASDNPDIQAGVQGTALVLASSPDYFGEGTVVVTAQDSSGATASDTFAVAITPVNDPPQVTLPDISFPEDSSYVLDLDDWVNDVDNNASELSWSARVIGAQGTNSPGAKIVNRQSSIAHLPSSIFHFPSVPGGIEVDTSDLQIVIDPATRTATFSVSGDSAGVFTATFTASDPGGLSHTDTMLVIVAAENDLPLVANPISDVIYPEDGGTHTVVADLNAVFSDPDPGTVLSFSAASDNPDIQVNVAGDSLTLNASLNYFGGGSVAVFADDGSGGLAGDTFLVNIFPLNDPPVIAGLPDTLGFREDSSASLHLWDYVEDLETADSLLSYTFSVSNDSLLHEYDPSTGLLTLSAAGGFSGAALLGVEVSDDSAATAAAAIIVIVEPLVGIGEPVDAAAPTDFALEQNYPNPFNPGTAISYQLSANSFVTLAIYDVQGRRVRTLVNENKAPGRYTVQWDGRDGGGRPAASGMYVYRLEAGGFRAVRKMILLK